MAEFKLDPMLVSALVVRETYGNGFLITHLSQSTDMFERVKTTLDKLIAIVLDGIPSPNFRYEIERMGHGTAKFLCGPIDVYDSTDWEVCQSYVEGIIEELTKANAFVKL